MLTTILVPLDGSALAERALPHAERLARAGAARLVLTRAVQAHTLPGTDPAEAQVRAIDAAESYLGGLAARLADASVNTEVAVPYGAAAPAILDEIGIRRPELVVMSTHGRGGLGRCVYGSVADQVLRRADVPLLLIPAACEKVWPVDRALRILVPLDGSNFAREALDPANELADLLDGDLLLLQVAEPPDYGLHSEAYLKEVAEALRETGKAVEAHSTLGQPASVVTTVARDQDVDLIVMATHGRGGLTRLVLGSVASGTLQRANVPLLLVRPVAVRRATAGPTTGAAGPAETRTDSQPVGSSVSISLSRRELALLERGLGDLLYSPESDWDLADPVLELQARLKQAEEAASRPAPRSAHGDEYVPDRRTTADR